MNKKTLLIAAGICGLAASSQAQLDPSLVAWYKFDEGASATVAANEVSGSPTGAIGTNVTTGVAGIAGNAYSFTGGAAQNDIVDMANASFFASINTAGAYTLSAWINSTEETGNRNTVVFAGNNTDSNDYSDIGTGFEGVDGEAYARVRPNTNDNPPAGGFFSGSDHEVVDGTWHYIAMTVSLADSLVSLYVDGALAATQVMPIVSFPTFNNFEVGRLGRSSPADGYLGLVDDVQVYDAALTSDQVLWLFNNPGEALTVVPEPAEVSLAIAAGLGLLAVARRRKHAKGMA